MLDQETKVMHLDELFPADYNPRLDLQPGDEEYEKLKKSIQEFGYVEKIIWNKQTGNMVGGHQRKKVLQDLGYEEVIVTVIDETEEREKMLNVALNKIGGDWDFPKLKDLLIDLDTGEHDLELTGYDLGEIEDLMTQVHMPEGETEAIDDDFDVDEELENIIEPVTKRGDIWQLGKHRLMCGDSTSEEAVRKLTNGEKADMVFTDPPYGMKKENDGILNDNLNFNDLLEFNKKWIPLTFGALKENGSWYCWGIDEPLMDIYSNILKPMAKENTITFRNLITWDKGNGQGQMSEDFRMYPIADEKCLFVMCGGDAAQTFSVNQEDYSDNMDKVRLYLETEISRLKQSDKQIANALGYKDGRTVNHWRSKSQFALPTRENYEALKEYGRKVLKDYDFLKTDYDFLKTDYDELKADYDELKANFYAGRSYFDNTHDNMNNVWHFGRTSQEERKLTGGHATPKPIELCARAIKSSSREDEVILDVFGGSGSTLIACEQLNRICCMMELDEKYCDVIINRWERYTGEKAIKINLPREVGDNNAASETDKATTG